MPMWRGWLLPIDHSPKALQPGHSYVVIVELRNPDFWHFGDWVDVVVDDRLPTDERGQLIFVRSRDRNEFWCALLEKAYAKLYGSYGDLHMGQISEAMVDFTGGIKSVISLKNPPSDLWSRLIRAVKLKSFMGCNTRSVKSGEQVLSNGLVLTHAYSVTGVEEVLYKNRMEQLIRVRNPWGNKTEWNGPWSDRSVQWTRIDPEIKEKLLLSRDDGEFWMAMQDFVAHYAELVICNLTPDFLEGENQQKWALSIHRGTWLKGQSSGGRMGNNDMFCINPQYCVTLTESDMDKQTNSCPFIVCLLQKPRDRQRNKSSNFYIACLLFKHSKGNRDLEPDQTGKICLIASVLHVSGRWHKVPPTFQVQNGKVPQTFLDERYLVKRGIKYQNTREVSESYQLGPGTYILVPSTYNPNEQAEFILRAYFQKGNYQKNTSSNSNHQQPTPALSRTNNSSWEQIFNEYAQTLQPRWSFPQSRWSDSCSPPLSPSPLSPTTLQARHHNSRRFSDPMSPTSSTAQSPEINAAGLQSILNKVFLDDQRRSEGFSLDSCRVFVLLMDFNGTGRLDKNNFRCLWEKLELFKDLFHNMDQDGSGLLHPLQLANSLQEAGFEVTNSAVKLMALRYGDSSGRISLESFINCFLRVEFTTKMYTKLSKGGSGLYLTAAEWMLLTTYL
ncbi:calpain-14-like [Heterodontus francisci]|uniref:calpain-14-like n=1 Tax=Heterodontus francisci TaxID=7792 RepID=UPI00355ADF8F